MYYRSNKTTWENAEVRELLLTNLLAKEFYGRFYTTDELSV